MEYDIKRGWFKNIEGDLLEQMMAQVFGNVKKEGDLLVSSYGVLERIEVKILAKDKLDIATVNKQGCAVDDDAEAPQRVRREGHRIRRQGPHEEGPEEGQGRHPLRSIPKTPSPSFLIIGARRAGLYTTYRYSPFRLDIIVSDQTHRAMRTQPMSAPLPSGFWGLIRRHGRRLRRSSDKARG